MSQSGFAELRPLMLAAYGPTALGSMGAGAIMPVIALSARDLGASVPMAAVVVALLGVAQLVFNLPAGALAARFGERAALLGAAAAEFAGGLVALFAPSLAVYAVGVVVIGLSTSVFGLARQSYLTAVIRPALRARAMSLMGATYRVGMLAGPFLGIPFIAMMGPQGAYVVALIGAGGSFILVLLATDITAQVGEHKNPATEQVPVFTVLARHRKVLLTLGVGIWFIAMTRALRVTLVPLWAEEIGLSAGQTSLIFGLSAAADLLLAYPGGLMMDRIGRRVVAVPGMIVLGVGLLLVPLSGSAGTLLLVTLVLGAGSGLGTGLILTLGADVSPVEGRAQFLAGWRGLADLGTAVAPGIIAALTVLSLTAAALGSGVLGLAGAAWLAAYVPRGNPGRSRPGD